ncbi:MAG: glycyl-radical enzyme activating protein [Oscillospiraceae bacterium]|nr:glycyl-radical enzyme activating protein [Oscillospiraceae bacterium]
MQKNNITALIYDIQGFSVQDGPGVRTTVFLKGCPLRCPWCHSPESQRFDRELNWMSIRCIGLDTCGMCLDVCPNGCIKAGEVTQNAAGDDIRYPEVDKTNCDECGKCAAACKATALYMCGDEVTIDDVMYRIKRDKPFFEDSGGGVTVSGGECLAQPEFTLELIKSCKELDINVAIDTTGFVKYDVIKSVMPYTDMFLYDLKCMDSDLHKQVIGVPNELILENAKRIAEAGGKLWIRIPVMPMYNDSEEHFKLYGEFLSEIKDAVIMVQLLPYHKMGLSKYARLLTNKQVFTAEPPSDALMDARKAQLEAMGLPVRIH